MSKTYEFSVEMTCGGCSGAVERVLKKLGDDVSKVDIDLEGKKVTITSTLDQDKLLETLKKTGKETAFLGIKE